MHLLSHYCIRRRCLWRGLYMFLASQWPAADCIVCCSNKEFYSIISVYLWIYIHIEIFVYIHIYTHTHIIQRWYCNKTGFEYTEYIFKSKLSVSLFLCPLCLLFWFRRERVVLRHHSHPQMKYNPVFGIGKYSIWL